MIRQRRNELVAHGNHKTECNGSLRYEVKQFTKVVLIQNVGVAVLTATPAYKSSQDPGLLMKFQIWSQKSPNFACKSQIVVKKVNIAQNRLKIA